MPSAIRVLVALAAMSALLVAPGLAAGVPVHASAAKVFVAGREVKFEHLGIAYNDPVAPASDSGLREMLDLVKAQINWQPGTRFAVVTRADGKLITLTPGSAALAVDGTAVAMPFAPFYKDSDLYVPLLPLAKALQLGVRGFKGGYVFVPQVLSVAANYDAQRTIVQMKTSAPAAYRSVYDAHTAALSISFPGFGTDVQGTFPLNRRDGLDVRTTENGPPGFPTTTVSIDLQRGVKFAAHRASDGLSVAAVLARNESALHVEDGTSAVGHAALTTPSPGASVSPAPHASPSAPTTTLPTGSGASQVATARPIVAVTSAPTLRPPPVMGTPPPSRPSPTASPTPAPTATPTAIPTASAVPAQASPAESASPTPTATPLEVKITAVAVTDIPNGGTRVTLTLNGGPVSFEWHRLAEPDNRYWLDITGVTLVGPSQVVNSALPFIKDIEITQFALDPQPVVRIAITPTQPIDVNVGPVAESSNQMGVEIEREPPGADAPKAGVGTIAFAPAQTPPPSRTPTQRDLIVIDPGHGGNDPGAMNVEYGLTESRLTLAVSLRLRDDLRRLGWRVVMTRDTDTEVGDPAGDDHQELQARVDVANAAGARVFVSVHINASVVHSLNGTTTYYWRIADRAFAQVMESDLVAEDGIADAGVKRNSFYVIKNTYMPSVLVETAFLSNPHDAALLAQPAFLERLARGIARGIMDFTGGPQAPL